MGMQSFWVLAALAVSWPAAGSVAAAGPVVIVVPHGVYGHEAERAAKERGCQGPNGVRPAAQLRAKYGVIEEYDVTCTTGVVRVHCDMGMCSAQR